MFLNTLKSKPEFTFELLQIMSYYIKQTDEKIFEMGQKTLEQRAAKLVLSMKDFFELDEQSYIDVLLRREDMANFIGVATESFIRKLGQFQKRGWIKTKGKKLKFLIRRHFCEYLQASVNKISKSKGIHLSLIR
ncbi:MAG: Crp/Fnr family transcriptional regulator [Flavobacteriaceae bacterium]